MVERHPVAITPRLRPVHPRFHGRGHDVIQESPDHLVRVVGLVAHMIPQRLRARRPSPRIFVPERGAKRPVAEGIITVRGRPAAPRPARRRYLKPVVQESSQKRRLSPPREACHHQLFQVEQIRKRRIVRLQVLERIHAAACAPRPCQQHAAIVTLAIELVRIQRVKRTGVIPVIARNPPGSPPPDCPTSESPAPHTRPACTRD